MAAVPPGPPVVAQVLGQGLVLLGGQGVALVARALELAAARAARDGIGLPPQARQLQAALEAATSGAGSALHARAGSPEVSEKPLRAGSPQDVVDVQEVAQVLELSDRQARTLCAGAVTGRKDAAGRWQVDRLELQTWRDDRQGARTA